jgi:hypothetical protein
MPKTTIAVLAGVAVAASAAAAFAASGTLSLGPATKSEQPTYQAYYDGHKDTYLVTDVSNKAQAASLHVNFAAAIGAAKGLPEQYFIQGKAAPGQLSVFGSEPGESDYNPLWDEIFVTWKAGAKPTLLVSDNQINALAKKGRLTMRDVHIVLNAPITHVGK